MHNTVKFLVEEPIFFNQTFVETNDSVGNIPSRPFLPCILYEKSKWAQNIAWKLGSSNGNLTLRTFMTYFANVGHAVSRS